jgi:hypothetical protein
MFDSIKDLAKSTVSPLTDYWAKFKNWIITIGIILLVLKFRDLIFGFIVKSAKEEVKAAETENTKLVVKEKQAKTQAEDLQKQAEDLDKNKPTVDKDWYKQ